MTSTVVCNLFAGPGAGKSTIAAGVFYELKKQNMNVEYVSEFAKDLTWEERRESLKDQLYIFGKQYHRIHRLLGKVDAIVTDSPILFSILYQPEPFFPSYFSLVKEVHDSVPSLNVLIKRVKPYLPAGRSQTEDEAKLLDDKIKALLKKLKIPYEEMRGDESGMKAIAFSVYALIHFRKNALN